VLKSKIAELESNIREVKEKEKKMIIDLSKDRVISEYEKRMKEMAEKIETLKTNLESSERNSWQSQSVQPTLISSPSKQNLRYG
jgi:predicted RNase H-like nuclease (RuvC/YqgF family)